MPKYFAPAVAVGLCRLKTNEKNGLILLGYILKLDGFSACSCQCLYRISTEAQFSGFYIKNINGILF
jgi:hypothetical protein